MTAGTYMRTAYHRKCTRDAANRKHDKVGNTHFYLDGELTNKVDIYDILVERQGNVCAICGQSETKLQHGKVQRLSMDHDHETNEVRELLCFTCNLQLGYIEDLEFVEKAMKYLLKHKGE